MDPQRDKLLLLDRISLNPLDVHSKLANAKRQLMALRIVHCYLWVKTSPSSLAFNTTYIWTGILLHHAVLCHCALKVRERTDTMQLDISANMHGIWFWRKMTLPTQLALIITPNLSTPNLPLASFQWQVDNARRTYFKNWSVTWYRCMPNTYSYRISDHVSPLLSGASHKSKFAIGSVGFPLANIWNA